MHRPPNDVVRVMVLTSTKYLTANVSIGTTDEKLDNFEVVTKRLIRDKSMEEIAQIDFPTIVAQLAMEAYRHGNESLFLTASIWIATRSPTSSISLPDLLDNARARPAYLMIETDDDGRLWRFRVEDIAPLGVMEPGIH